MKSVRNIPRAGICGIAAHPRRGLLIVKLLAVASVIAYSHFGGPAGFADAAAGDPAAAVVSATKAYMQGSYAEAAELYESALAEGLHNPSLHYNLGNSYFRLNEFGKAIAHYRVALAELPGDADILANLTLARTKPVDRIEEQESLSSQIKRAFFLRGWLPQFQLELLFFACYGLFWLSFVVQTLETRFQSASAGLQAALLLTVIYTGVLAYGTRLDRVGKPAFALSGEEKSFSPGVILPKEVKVYSGNSEQFQVVFVLHMGAEVEVAERRGDWIEIVLPEKRGWIKAAECYVIS